MKRFFFIGIFITFFAHTTDTAWEKSHYFNTKFLLQFDKVHETLVKQDNFKKVTFKSSDGIKLDGLFLQRPHATSNIIFCGGFYPGRKEGIATFFKLVPDDCNILFFDARGHGKSKGRFWSTLYNYTQHEYKDIIGALNFVTKNNDKPIIIHGICVGALHAARTLIHLSTTNQSEKYPIKGFIFDSGLASALKATNIPKKHFKNKVLPILLKKIYTSDSTKQIKKRLLYKLTKPLVQTITAITVGAVRIPLAWTDRKTCIAKDITKITCPIFFIHSYDDDYTPITEVQKLSCKVKKKKYWWITQPSHHACHHLKHKYTYKKNLLEFFQQVLNT